jgi:hypothetical protein
MKRNFLVCLSCAISLFTIVACSSAQSDSIQAVQTYLNALASKDAETLVSVSCSEWESSARLELDSFAAVTPELVDLQCSEASIEEDEILVACTGQLKLDYNGEIQNLDLAGQFFRTVQEGDEWLMCGYK